MTGLLIIDTETSGVMDYTRPADAAGQPRVAEFAGIGLDRSGNVEFEWQRYVKPDGWAMTESATAVNKLTDEFLATHGVPIGEVLDFYEKHIRNGWTVVAFGAQFDCKMMRAEFRHADRDDLFELTKNICLMREARPFAKSIGREIIKAGGSQKGWVKLSDLCAFFNITRQGEHGALHDARDLVLCFQQMLKHGYAPEGRVHHARNHEEIKANA